MKKWNIHFCPLDKTCRRFDPPWRIYLNTPWFHLGIALRPNSRYVGKIDLAAWKERREVIPVGRQSYWINFERK